MAKKIHVRPSRSQSKASFVVGIIFCLIGVCVVIPMAGPFGILWTGMAAWITYVNYRNGFTNRGIDSRVIEVEDDGQDIHVTSHSGYHSYSYNTQGNAVDDSVEERLRKLQSLYDQSLITYEEYEQKRKDILAEL